MQVSGLNRVRIGQIACMQVLTTAPSPCMQVSGLNRVRIAQIARAAALGDPQRMVLQVSRPRACMRSPRR